MIALPLRLIHSHQPSPVAAGFLPGSDTAAWLEEMAKHPGARCFAVPSSAGDPEAGGLLILPADSKPLDSRRIVPCAIEYEKVAVPCGYQVDPVLTAEEARRLLLYPVYFFHPALGLVAFEPQDVVTETSLVVPPLLTAGSWNHAVAGPPPPPPLTAVTLLIPDDTVSLFGDAASEIASEPPHSLRRQSPPLTRILDICLGAAAALGRWLFGLIAGLLSKVNSPRRTGPVPTHPAARTFRSPPLNPSRPTAPWRRKLEHWTARQAKRLEEFRHREINRLVHLLETNPEAGLRHAIPLHGGEAPRGTAEPGWQLNQKTPLFGSQRRGGPADIWQVPEDTQAYLNQKYRELAELECLNGRFDRAAYIFAELLGDWNAAAKALAKGGRHQEAARIFRDKLGLKLQAAACLEAGGLIADAIPLFSELGDHEKCGDLWMRLDCPAEATKAYRSALRGNGDRINDARILFDKLRQPDLALRVLASGYPDSHEAGECLKRQFEYLGRLDARDASLALARSLALPENQISNQLEMMRTLQAIHKAHTNPDVRASIADVAIESAGRWLSRRSPASQTLLGILPDFVPGDKLLQRDAARFAETASGGRETPRQRHR